MLPSYGTPPPVAQMCAVAGAIQWSLNRGLQLQHWYFGQMNYIVPLYLQAAKTSRGRSSRRSRQTRLSSSPGTARRRGRTAGSLRTRERQERGRTERQPFQELASPHPLPRAAGCYAMPRAVPRRPVLRLRVSPRTALRRGRDDREVRGGPGEEYRWWCDPGADSSLVGSPGA